MKAWQRYEAFKVAFAEFVFSDDAPGHPVYLGLDDDGLEKVLSAWGVDASDRVEALVAAVGGALRVDVNRQAPAEQEPSDIDTICERRTQWGDCDRRWVRCPPCTPHTARTAA